MLDLPKKGTKCSDNCHHIGNFANTKRMSGVAAYCVVAQPKPFHGFLTFDMDKLGITCRHH